MPCGFHRRFSLGHCRPLVRRAVWGEGDPRHHLSAADQPGRDGFVPDRRPPPRRIGLVNMAVFTHLPSNLTLMLVPAMPRLPLASAIIVARHALSQRDRPARESHRGGVPERRVGPGGGADPRWRARADGRAELALRDCRGVAPRRQRPALPHLSPGPTTRGDSAMTHLGSAVGRRHALFARCRSMARSSCSSRRSAFSWPHRRRVPGTSFVEPSLATLSWARSVTSTAVALGTRDGAERASAAALLLASAIRDPLTLALGFPMCACVGQSYSRMMIVLHHSVQQRALIRPIVHTRWQAMPVVRSGLRRAGITRNAARSDAGSRP